MASRRRQSSRSVMAVPTPVVLGVAMVVLASSVTGARGQLRMGFYAESCPAAERIVGDYVRQHVRRVPTVAAALLRLHFHDCFVRGCDASVLLNSTGGSVAEKDAPPNLTLRGFGFIDRVKNLVEDACPGVVSCADVLALAARDAVAAIGGPSWRVPTGRRDGTVSSMEEALDEIPKPTMSFPEIADSFASKGLGVRDLVWLLGAHTIGIAHCSSFADRLYGYAGADNATDPSLDAAYAANLRERKCRAHGGGSGSGEYADDGVVEMDPGSFLTFDLGYYRAVLKHQGLFGSDASLLTDAAARADVAGVAAGPEEVFFQVFARSMARLGAVQVKTGAEGEVRRNCAVVNGGYK
ncbi:peroxidase 3-like [Phragmites australis]|uniref:peroxidase 3-like n=1 Tax=Phragmites australis TaxID=29695 RepID=UPI002D76CFD3|nr:peroxidase 3-like [Phragmites australis]